MKTGCVKTQGTGSICDWTPDLCGPYEKNSNQGRSVMKEQAPGQEAASTLHHELSNSTGNPFYGIVKCEGIKILTFSFDECMSR